MRSFGAWRRGTAKRSEMSYVEALTDRYVNGSLGLDEFERLVDQALRGGGFMLPAWYVFGYRPIADLSR